jgi:SAM-dependent methyltransferase
MSNNNENNQPNSRLEIGNKVLNFYKQMPFNYFDSPEDCTALIKAKNHVPLYFPAADTIFGKDSSFLELGCGVGWFSNSVQYYYKSSVTAIDFNPVAVGLAQETAKLLNLSSKFETVDLFKFDPGIQYDVAASFGVLHHTADCLAGITKVCSLVHGGGGGGVIIGLYHKYGRAPFLEYFTRLKQENLSESELFEKYKELDERTRNRTNSESWFRDQVLHPHETQHTLKEVCEVFKDCGVELTATSVNGFEPFDDEKLLFEKEQALYERGIEMLRQKRYFPGFFVVVGKKQK